MEDEEYHQPNPSQVTLPFSFIPSLRLVYSHFSRTNRIILTFTHRNYHRTDNDHHCLYHIQKSKKWRRKKKKRAAAAAALVRGIHVKQCVGGMVIDVMAVLVASEHVHTIVRKHVKRAEVFPSTMGSNNTHNTVTAAIFGNPMLSYPDPSNKSTKKTRKQGLGVSADGVNNTHGGTSGVSEEEVSTMHSLRQVIHTQQSICLFLYLILDASSTSKLSSLLI